MSSESQGDNSCSSKKKSDRWFRPKQILDYTAIKRTMIQPVEGVCDGNVPDGLVLFVVCGELVAL